MRHVLVVAAREISERKRIFVAAAAASLLPFLSPSFRTSREATPHRSAPSSRSSSSPRSASGPRSCSGPPSWPATSPSAAPASTSRGPLLPFDLGREDLGASSSRPARPSRRASRVDRRAEGRTPGRFALPRRDDVRTRGSLLRRPPLSRRLLPRRRRGPPIPFAVARRRHRPPRRLRTPRRPDRTAPPSRGYVESLTKAVPWGIAALLLLLLAGGPSRSPRGGPIPGAATGPSR